MKLNGIKHIKITVVIIQWEWVGVTLMCLYSKMWRKMCEVAAIDGGDGGMERISRDCFYDRVCRPRTLFRR